MHKPLLLQCCFCVLVDVADAFAQKWYGYKVVDHNSGVLFKSDLVLRCFCRPEITGTLAIAISGFETER